jgi:hypothetical protein
VTGLSKNIVIRPGPGKLVLTGLAPRVQIRQYVTMEHLWTACHAARLCSEREPQLQRNVPDAEHRSPAMTAIFFAAAFLEALVNEVILDVAEPPRGGPSARVAGIPVDAKTRGAFQKLWKNERSIKGGPLGKYQAALDVVGKRRYDETRPPFKSAPVGVRPPQPLRALQTGNPGYRRRARLREGAQESQSR